MWVLGFEPRKALSTVALEATPFDHSGTPTYPVYLDWGFRDNNLCTHVKIEEIMQF
jgi:hypothetical protein